jgi:hypothetical protein
MPRGRGLLSSREMRGSRILLGPRVLLSSIGAALFLLLGALLAKQLFFQPIPTEAPQGSKNNPGASSVIEPSNHEAKLSSLVETLGSGALASTAKNLVTEGQGAIEPKEPEAIARVIDGFQEISASYDPKRLQEIEPYLYSRNLMIRAAAVDAVLNLGDSSGAEILRRAARSMLEPKEELETLEKAALLALPSGTFGTRKTRK